MHMWANNLHLFMLYLRQLYSIDLQLIGVVNKTHSWTLPIYLRHSEASFSPISIVSLHLRVAQMPRSSDLAIFVRTTGRQTDRRQTKPIALPLAHARGVIKATIIMQLQHCITHTKVLHLKQLLRNMYIHCMRKHSPNVIINTIEWLSICLNVGNGNDRTSVSKDCVKNHNHHL